MFDALFTSTNHPPLLFLIAVVGGYLSGSVPFGLILTKLSGLGDIRAIGSGNIGATNVLRTGNKKVAALTLLLDGLKGLIPVLVAKQFHMDLAVLTALAALLGHIFPVWLGFKGGKGVATGIGVLLGLSWHLGVCVICLWLLAAIISRISSLSALTAFGLSPLLAFMLTRDFQTVVTALVIAVIVWLTHHQNISRLIAGTEGRISLGGGKKDANG
jgi:glycerol-3-phosphate acyltransferase PlsY